MEKGLGPGGFLVSRLAERFGDGNASNQSVLRENDLFAPIFLYYSVMLVVFFLQRLGLGKLFTMLECIRVSATAATPSSQHRDSASSRGRPAGDELVLQL